MTHVYEGGCTFVRENDIYRMADQRSLGYEDVADLDGGSSAWPDSGLSVDSHHEGP